MAFSSFAFVIAITLAILNAAGCSPVTAIGDTISFDLIHRDSVESPFYDPSMNFSQRIGHAIKRSIISAKRFTAHHNPKGSTYQTQIIPDHGEFLLNISYGNPSHQVLAIADTGSDLSWIQCEPCIHCYNHTGSLFNPKTSSTYKPVACESNTCKAIGTIDTNCTKTKSCPFYASYAGGSVSNGTISTETVTLGDRVLPNIVFGCGFYNENSFRPTWGGIVGLGGGDYSLVSQISSVVPGKFSYCLIPFTLTNGISNKSSKMIFGDIDFGPNVVSTPLVLILPKTYYYVTLEGISVDGRRLNLVSDGSKPTKPSKGNMIIDSGTTLTTLPPKLYNEFVAIMKDAINVRTIKDPQKILSLCYLASKVTNLPKVTIHFEGADVELSRENIFVTVSKHIMCLGMRSAAVSLPVLGNIAQMNYMMIALLSETLRILQLLTRGGPTPCVGGAREPPWTKSLKELKTHNDVQDFVRVGYENKWYVDWDNLDESVLKTEGEALDDPDAAADIHPSCMRSVESGRCAGKYSNKKKNVKKTLFANFDAESSKSAKSGKSVVKKKRLVAMNKLEDQITPTIRKRLECLKEEQRDWIFYPSGYEELELSGVPYIYVVAGGAMGGGRGVIGGSGDAESGGGGDTGGGRGPDSGGRATMGGAMGGGRGVIGGSGDAESGGGGDTGGGRGPDSGGRATMGGGAEEEDVVAEEEELMGKEDIMKSMEHDYLQGLLDDQRQKEEKKHQEKLDEEAFQQAMKEERMYERMELERTKASINFLVNTQESITHVHPSSVEAASVENAIVEPISIPAAQSVPAIVKNLSVQHAQDETINVQPASDNAAKKKGKRSRSEPEVPFRIYYKNRERPERIRNMQENRF
nr:aspartic proteinase CDR1-like [Tanacetum cinerariifolium]